jgi:hypothetical protein
MDVFSWVTLIATVLMAASAVVACCRHDLLFQRRRDDYRPANTTIHRQHGGTLVSPPQQARMLALSVEAAN